MILAKELSDNDIARELGLSVKTVRNRRHALRRRGRLTELKVLSEEQRATILLNRARIFTEQEIADLLGVDVTSLPAMRYRLKVTVPKKQSGSRKKTERVKPIQIDLVDTEEL